MYVLVFCKYHPGKYIHIIKTNNAKKYVIADNFKGFSHPEITDIEFKIALLKATTKTYDFFTNNEKTRRHKSMEKFFEAILRLIKSFRIVSTLQKAAGESVTVRRLIKFGTARKSKSKLK